MLPSCVIIMAKFVTGLVLFGTFIQGMFAEQANKTKQALEYVEYVRSNPCRGGTEEVLPVQFHHEMWRHYAQVAVHMANFLTDVLVNNNNTLSQVEEQLLFNMVRTNVNGDDHIFGSAIAVEEYVFPKYRIYCPYAYKKDRVYAHDISLNYNYLDPSTEWYHVLRQRDWGGAHMLTDSVTYRHNLTSHADTTEILHPVSVLSDGHWTHPYYDCGGGDVWMVTYSSPVFGLEEGSRPVFKGIGTIDIELTYIDINQCDESDSEVAGSLDVFRGTHNCRPSTKCVAIAGRGFIRGSYKCVCRDGYYFPRALREERGYPEEAFNGTLLEYLSVEEEAVSDYECTPCAPGCDTCQDDSPCLYSNNLYLRSTLLILSAAMVILSGLTSVVLVVQKDRKVIKSASPVFLHIVNIGAVLMYTPMLLMFPETSDALCTVMVWPRHLGFALAYGALLLKTWRIATIFRVTSTRRLHLTDKALLQRLVPVVAVAILYLTAWTGLNYPKAVWFKTSSTHLKFLACTVDWWDHGAFVGEILFLMWGAYLSYIVRKAPSGFHESKYIRWTIYNYIILGSFIIVIREFIARGLGSDWLYLIEFIYFQVCVTGMMCVIYLPKFWVLYKYADSESKSLGSVIPSSVLGTVLVGNVSCKSVQVDIIKSPKPVATGNFLDKQPMMPSSTGLTDC